MTIQVASGNPSGTELQAIPTTGAKTPAFDMEKVQLWVISLALCLASSSGEIKKQVSGAIFGHNRS